MDQITVDKNDRREAKVSDAQDIENRLRPILDQFKVGDMGLPDVIWLGAALNSLSKTVGEKLGQVKDRLKDEADAVREPGKSVALAGPAGTGTSALVSYRPRTDITFRRPATSTQTVEGRPGSEDKRATVSAVRRATAIFGVSLDNYLGFKLKQTKAQREELEGWEPQTDAQKKLKALLLEATNVTETQSVSLKG